MSWIPTHKRKRFDLLEPRADQVDIEDIAHALARQCRFNGHTYGFYSVAQHSVVCSRIVSPLYAFDALMHDAAEAYVGDVVSPVKRLLNDVGGNAFRDIENRIAHVIAEVFGNQFPLHERVEEADATMLACEVDFHLGGPLPGWEPPLVEPVPIAKEDLAGWGPIDAEAAFLARFNELGGTSPPLPKPIADPMCHLAGANVHPERN